MDILREMKFIRAPGFPWRTPSNGAMSCAAGLRLSANAFEISLDSVFCPGTDQGARPISLIARELNLLSFFGQIFPKKRYFFFFFLTKKKRYL